MPAPKLFALRDPKPWALGGNKTHIVGEDGIPLCKKTYTGKKSERVSLAWIKEHTGEPDMCKACCKAAAKALETTKK